MKLLHRRETIRCELKELEGRVSEIERQQMSTQADVDAVVVQVGEVAADLATAHTTLQAEIDALATANPAIDVAALQAAVAPLDQAAKDLGAIVPTPPAAPVA